MTAPAFADPVLDAQVTFRTVMDAMARPGRIRPLVSDLSPPAPLSPAAAAIALTLLDYEASFWLDAPLARAPEVANWLHFHTGAPRADAPDEAAFAFSADPASAPALEAFALGSMEYPDRSTTLVLQLDSISDAALMRLSGPGIEGECKFAAAPLPDDFIGQAERNRACFPRGIDLILVSADKIVALPRSTRIEPGA
jgi:alpha-D-ribose 1-methylphosphonate 5-triphosphate synthase subunit PhnH